MSDQVQVGGDDDTNPGSCAGCALREVMDAALGRFGASLLTVVSRFEKPPVGPCVVERSYAILTLSSGDIVRGDGHSRDDAIWNALEKAGAV